MSSGPWGRGGQGWLWLLVAGLALAALIFSLARQFPEVLMAEENQMRLAHSLLWLGLFGSALILHFRARPRGMLKNAAIWIAIGAGVLALYSFRHEAAAIWERMLAELLPHRARPAGDGAVTVRARQDGHFAVEAEVNGVPLRFLVDTGASVVTLTPGDARRIGIDPAKLSYDQRVSTANGVVLAAPVRLKSVRVGPIVLNDVRASVNQAEMSGSLLGMSFLGRLRSYEVRDGALTLRP